MTITQSPENHEKEYHLTCLYINLNMNPITKFRSSSTEPSRDIPRWSISDMIINTIPFNKRI